MQEGWHCTGLEMQVGLLILELERLEVRVPGMGDSKASGAAMFYCSGRGRLAPWEAKLMKRAGQALRVEFTLILNLKGYL